MDAFASWPLFAAQWLGHVTGWPLVLAGLWLAAWVVMAAASVDVALPNRLVVQGPYTLSRNPMYVAWTLVYLGITFVVNTAWPMVALPVVLLSTHVVVPREERYLEGRFGAEYDATCARSAGTLGGCRSRPPARDTTHIAGIPSWTN